MELKIKYDKKDNIFDVFINDKYKKSIEVEFYDLLLLEKCGLLKLNLDKIKEFEIMSLDINKEILNKLANG